MDCVICKLKKVSPLLIPYGGFLCSSGHMQCMDCNAGHNHRCGLCGNTTIYILMISNPHPQDVAAAQARVASLAVSLSSSGKMPSFWFCSPSLFDEIKSLSIVPLKQLYIKDATKEDTNKGSLASRLDMLYAQIHRNTLLLAALTNEQENPAPALIGKQSIDAEYDLMGQQNARRVSEAVLEVNTSKAIQAEEPPNTINSDLNNVCESLKDRDGASLKNHLQTLEPLATYMFPSDNCESNENIWPAPDSMQPGATAPDRDLHSKFGKQSLYAAAINNQLANNIMDVKKRDEPDLDVCLRGIFQSNQEDPKTLQPSSRIDMEKDNDKDKKLSHPHIVKGQHMPRNIKEPCPPHCDAISSTSSSLLQYVMSAKPNVECSIPEAIRRMTPFPLQCPYSKCSAFVFISDFQKHFETDHSQLPMERITTYQSKNLLIDPRTEYSGNNHSHYIFYLKDDTMERNIQLQKYFLPLIIMSSRASLTKSCGKLKLPKVAEFLVIWVTSIVHKQVPISVTLTVWLNTSTGTMPSHHMTYSGNVYCISKSQKAKDVMRSGQMLMLSVKDVSSVTNNFKDNFHMQLKVSVGNK